jgi:hypothetical protein
MKVGALHEINNELFLLLKPGSKIKMTSHHTSFLLFTAVVSHYTLWSPRNLADMMKKNGETDST